MEWDAAGSGVEDKKAKVEEGSKGGCGWGGDERIEIWRYVEGEYCKEGMLAEWGMGCKSKVGLLDEETEKKRERGGMRGDLGGEGKGGTPSIQVLFLPTPTLENVHQTKDEDLALCPL